MDSPATAALAAAFADAGRCSRHCRWNFGARAPARDAAAAWLLRLSGATGRALKLSGLGEAMTDRVAVYRMYAHSMVGQLGKPPGTAPNLVAMLRALKPRGLQVSTDVGGLRRIVGTDDAEPPAPPIGAPVRLDVRMGDDDPEFPRLLRPFARSLTELRLTGGA
eukprot:gene47613-64887_t